MNDIYTADSECPICWSKLQKPYSELELDA